MNWFVLILLVLLVAALIIFMNLQNKRDRRKLTDQLNSDYRKSKEEEGDTDIDEIRK